jgi:hypothetical protein
MTAEVRNQQELVYTAETIAFGGRDYGEIFTLGEIQEWIDAARDSWWWTRNYAKVLRIEVGPARKGGPGSVGWFEPDKNAGRIELVPNHRNFHVIAHEVAHVMAEALFDSHSHDPYFAREYLKLVYFILGSEEYVKLFTAFNKHGVEFDA